MRPSPTRRVSAISDSGMPNRRSIRRSYRVWSTIAVRNDSVATASYHTGWSSRGGPGRTTTVGPGRPSVGGTTRPGAVPAGPRTVAPSGTVACLRVEASIAAWSRLRQRRSIGSTIAAIRRSSSSSSTGSRPWKRPTTSAVRSSAVGPRPPVVTIRSTPCSTMKRSCASRSAGRSPQIVVCARSTPSSTSRSASQGPLRSRTRPASTSVPVTTMPARALTRVPRRSQRAPTPCRARAARRSSGARSFGGRERPWPLARREREADRRRRRAERHPPPVRADARRGAAEVQAQPPAAERARRAQAPLIHRGFPFAPVDAHVGRLDRIDAEDDRPSPSRRGPPTAARLAPLAAVGRLLAALAALRRAIPTPAGEAEDQEQQEQPDDASGDEQPGGERAPLVSVRLAGAGRATGGERGRRLLLGQLVVRGPVLLDEHARVEAEVLGVRLEERAHEGRPGEQVELLVLEGTQVLRANLRRLLDVGDVDLAAHPRLAEGLSDPWHGAYSGARGAARRIARGDRNTARGPGRVDGCPAGQPTRRRATRSRAPRAPPPRPARRARRARAARPPRRSAPGAPSSPRSRRSPRGAPSCRSNVPPGCSRRAGAAGASRSRPSRAAPPWRSPRRAARRGRGRGRRRSRRRRRSRPPGATPRGAPARPGDASGR